MELGWLFAIRLRGISPTLAWQLTAVTSLLNE